MALSRNVVQNVLQFGNLHGLETLIRWLHCSLYLLVAWSSLCPRSYRCDLWSSGIPTINALSVSYFLLPIFNFRYSCVVVTQILHISRPVRDEAVLNTGWLNYGKIWRKNVKYTRNFTTLEKHLNLYMCDIVHS